MKRSLLIGCGNSRVKKVHKLDQPDWVGELTTLDMDPNCGADFVLDIAAIAGFVKLPFDDDTFDEIGAYDCLEHWGQQGDWRGWFNEMAEYWRILKPGGTMGIIVPIGADALADPGHVRFFSKAYFGFLRQSGYDAAIAEGAPITDYRWYWKLNFEIEHLDDSNGHHLAVMLRKA